MGYAWNKLRSAVHCLAQPGSQRERLTAAIGLHLICLRPKDLPAASRAEFASVIDRLCLGRVLEQKNASVKRMVDAIDDCEVAAMVASILSVYDAVTRYQPILATAEAP